MRQRHIKKRPTNGPRVSNGLRGFEIMREPVAFLVQLSWPDLEYTNDTPEQVAAIRNAIECLCGVESVTDLPEYSSTLSAAEFRKVAEDVILWISEREN